MATSTASIPRRLNAIKRFVREYFPMEAGTLIDRHTELLRVFNIRGSIHEDHPHKMARVYITRQALKHVIESRKEELMKNHTEIEALEIICFAIDHLQETITNFDKYEFVPPTHYYVKDYARLGKPPLRIALDSSRDRLEIKSIHFTKRK